MEIHSKSQPSRIMIERMRKSGMPRVVLLFLFILIFTALTTKWLDTSILAGHIPRHIKQSKAFEMYAVKPDCHFKCMEELPLSPNNGSSSTSGECPGYFQWIHEDLKPWKHTGVTREMVERAKESAHIRIVIVSGRLYVEKYKKNFQTRDVVTIWGILQLLRLYPTKLPDLDLMFELGDDPIILKSNYGGPGASIPPPLFHYCGNESTFDIVFPDWSFMVNTPADSSPCILQPPYDETTLQAQLQRKESLRKQVELREAGEDIRKKHL